MNELNTSELQVALNKVCFSSDFKMFFTSKHHYCPNGMTIGVVDCSQEGNKELIDADAAAQNKKDYFMALVIRKYGYDSSSNRGTSIYDDLSDFISEPHDFTNEELDTVIEYFKTRKPELYKNYFVGTIIYLNGI